MAREESEVEKKIRSPIRVEEQGVVMMGFGDVKIEGGVVLVRVNRTRSATA